MTLSTQSLAAFRTFIEDTQRDLWGRLDDDLRSATNGRWSIAAANTASSIIRAARLVGVTRWDETPTVLVFGGVYAALCEIGAVATQLPTADEITKAYALRDGLNRTPLPPVADLRARYAATIAAMRDDAQYVTGAAS